MTPVQLPEVPAPNKRAFYFCNKCGHMGSEGPKHPKHGTTDEDCGYLAVTDGDSYTAAQLRAYATEAIRQAANAIFAEGWYLACDWASRDDLKFDIDSPAFEADRAARLGNLLTQPEQNSGR